MEKEIEKNKRKIVSLLCETKREGIENVIRYIEESGFYEAPSSICRHHNWKGGLAEHCLGVYRIASEMNNELPHESLVIAGILHDICKASKLYYDADGNIHRPILTSRGMADVLSSYWNNVDYRLLKMKGLLLDGIWEVIMLRMRRWRKSNERDKILYGRPFIRQIN